MKFTLLGENQEKVEIYIMKRKYTEALNDWDLNWVESEIIVNIAGYSARFPADLRTDELKDFVDGLNKMNKSLKGKAELINIDTYIDIECNVTPFGQLNWSVKTTYPAVEGAELTFGFQSDQSYLKPLISQIEDVLSVYPVIGQT